MLCVTACPLLSLSIATVQKKCPEYLIPSTTTTASSATTFAAIAIVSAIIATHVVPLVVQVVSSADTVASATSSSTRGSGPAAGAATASRGSGTGAGTTAAGVEVPSQLTRDGLQVHEVAEAGAGTFAHLVLPTASLAEVGHRR